MLPAAPPGGLVGQPHLLIVLAGGEYSLTSLALRQPAASLGSPPGSSVSILSPAVAPNDGLPQMSSVSDVWNEPAIESPDLKPVSAQSSAADDVTLGPPAGRMSPYHGVT